jgi:hypothetical protein
MIMRLNVNTCRPRISLLSRRSCGSTAFTAFSAHVKAPGASPVASSKLQRFTHDTPKSTA